MHLQPDELIDLAEGTRAESSATHLAECAVCRLQLAELKAMMSAAADVDVPEPSPLFWDHFSARVRQAVDAEGAPRRSFWTWPRVVIPAVSVAAAVLAVAVTLNRGSASRASRRFRRCAGACRAAGGLGRSAGGPAGGRRHGAHAGRRAVVRYGFRDRAGSRARGARQRRARGDALDRLGAPRAAAAAAGRTGALGRMT